MPVQVKSGELKNVVAVSAGLRFSICLTKEGKLYAWGVNDFGQLGDGSKNHQSTPVAVKDLDEVASIASHTGRTLALKKDGTVWAWGVSTLQVPQRVKDPNAAKRAASSEGK